jgi:ATPase subunit of ABC transporter with duplicated ATPase domains
MIRLDNISEQNGKRLVFIGASTALQKGEKIGLVGPNGAGTTTLFRMIVGQDEPARTVFVACLVNDAA